jgi:hypothetical protein
MVPCPQEGLPMTILVLTPTTPILPTPPATARGRRKKKEPIAPLPPHLPPPCALCEKEGHQTNNCPSLPVLWNLIPLNQTPTTPVTTASPTTPTPTSSKGLRTKFACAICSEYGHYTHHCPALPRFRQTLAAVRQNFQNNPRPATSSSNITDIRYVTTTVNERMRCPCSLCDSLAHFTYQCPIILAYRQRQLTLCHQLAAAVIDITSPLEDFHVISPKPKALPTPPWFLDDISEDLPRNPPNSPIHSLVDTIHPTTMGTPQCFNIWFMTSEPSSSAHTTPITSPAGGNHTRAEITPYDPLYSHRFQYTRKYWKSYTAQTLPGTHYIIMPSSFHRKTSCLLTKTPFTWSKPKILSHPGLSIGSTIPFLPLTPLKKVIWLTFPPRSKSTFPLQMALSKKSSLELRALLRKSPHTKPSSRNTGIFSPSHTQRFLALTRLLSSIASTPSLTSHQFARNNDCYTHPKPRLSKPK